MLSPYFDCGGFFLREEPRWKSAYVFYDVINPRNDQQGQNGS